MKDRVWGYPRNVFWAGLTSFFNDFSSEMIVAIFPAFFKAVLKSGAAALGLVEGVADASANLFKIVSGRWSDRVNKRKIFAVLGYALSTLTRPFYVLVGSVAEVVGLRLADRIGKGVREAPRDALISFSTPQAELGRSFGFHRAMDTAGAILGPLTAYLILRQWPGAFNKIFITAFFIGILGVLSFLLVVEVAGSVGRAGSRLPFASFPKQFKTYLLSAFILSAGTLPVAVMLLRTQDSGLAIADIPLFYMLYSMAYAAFSSSAGRAADKIGDRIVLSVGYLFLLLGYVVLEKSAAEAALLIGFVLLGLFSALTDGVMRSYAARLTTGNIRGTAYGYLNGASGFGALIAGVGGGYTWQHFGSGAAFSLGAAIILVGLLAFGLTQK